MRDVSRRNFLTATAGAAGYFALAGTGARAADGPPPPPQVTLGKTGISLSRVGQGTGMSGGNRQSNHSRMGFEKLVALLKHSYERGITFFDMADLYGTHVYFREVLRSVKRDQLTLLTKLWWRYDKLDPKTDAEAIKKVAATTLERFCHELTTNYIDIVLLHCMTVPNWPDEVGPYMEALAEAKRKGQVRAVGISAHNLGALETAATCPWVDVVLARINPRGAKMDGSVEQVVPVLRKIKENGKALIGMKVFGEGSLAKQPQDKEECIRYAQSLGLLDAMTIGFEAPEQVDETLQLLARFPASPVA
jgi:1-deoxyxylulose-5-phosphate synthase